jgi:hypothetical protein
MVACSEETIGVLSATYLIIRVRRESTDSLASRSNVAIADSILDHLNAVSAAYERIICITGDFAVSGSSEEVSSMTPQARPLAAAAEVA